MPPFRHKTKTGRTINFSSKEKYRRWRRVRTTATAKRKSRERKEDNLRRKTITPKAAERKFASRSDRSQAVDRRTKSRRTFNSPNRLWGSKINRYDVMGIDTPANDKKNQAGNASPAHDPKKEGRRTSHPLGRRSNGKKIQSLEW